jgi:hypothetical protein
MSLGIVIKGPEGLVLAAESRVTLSAESSNGQKIHVNFDNATKLLSFSSPNTTVGVVNYGLAAIGLRTPHSFVPEFEAGLPLDRLSVHDFAKRLSDFFMQQWQAVMPADYSGPNISFVIGGFNEDEPYGRVFLVEIPKASTPVDQHTDQREFGLTWGGQREFVDRLVKGYDYRLPKIISDTLDLQPSQFELVEQALSSLAMSIPLQAMPLQDCVNLAIFFIRTTITAQRLTVGIRGCGGPIDVAIITRRRGLRYIQRKEVIGEIGTITEAFKGRKT